MSSLNKVQLIGNLGKDIELKRTQEGKAVGSMSIATTETWKDSNGEKKESTEWHNVTMWGQLAETCHKWLSKGSKVYVEGKIKTENYEKDGQKKYITKINAHEVIFLPSPAKNQASKPNFDASQFPSGANRQDIPKQVSRDLMDDLPF